ncbi:MAG: carbamoyltransferase HypF [Chlorobi bacterium]|nr:carbamoyltransferase HypF [Chlorobiota bacterium]
MAGVAGKTARQALNTKENPPETRLRITVGGIVQGVGFRPFVYRLALSLGLKGFIRNTPSGVLLEVQGDPHLLEGVPALLQEQAPPLSRITSLAVEGIACEPCTAFEIDGSLQGSAVETLVPPDIALCARCRDELFDPQNRRYRYPFINCTDCGPRYTIVEGIPYDRPFTSMKGFAMCDECRREYGDPLDRRFHAQPDACPVCGPRVTLLDRDGERIRTEDPLREASRLLGEGMIVAVKGVGGFHLAVDARNAGAVRRLRALKGREDKPFAVMMREQEQVNRYCRVSREEAAALGSAEAPIVLLAKKPGCGLPDAVAPGNDRLGVMLPYSPLHAVLLDEGPDVLVMTSANHSEEPVLHDEHEALMRLGGIADVFLVHDRPILQRCDDSVAVHLSGSLRFLRRSRGYVPAPVMLSESGPPLIAAGGELKNTVCLLSGRHAILSQHLGDMKNYGTWRFFTETVSHLQELFRTQPELLVHDLHPDYLTTRWASTQEMPFFGVQHHHAHLASCLAENLEPGPAIGLLLDGTGYGPDGTIWGGEVLVGDAAGAERFASLECMPLPGGDAAVRHPWRTGLGYLSRSCPVIPDLPFLQGKPEAEVLELLEKKVACVETSSCGRLFDAVAAISGLCSTISYEGQAALALMHAAQGAIGSRGFRYGIERSERSLSLQIAPLVHDVADAAGRGMPLVDISRRFHRTLCMMLQEITRMAASATGIKTVVLSGGVFQNMLLFETLVRELQAGGYRVLSHTAVPCNDGGLSLGQAVVGREYLKGNCRGVRY